MSKTLTPGPTWRKTILLGLSIVPLLSGISGLLGWTINREFFTSVGQGWIPMAPSSASLFILFSLVFILNLNRINAFWLNLVTTSVSILIITIASIFFFLSLFKIQPEIEHLGFDMESAYNSGIGHMSPVTALLFTVLGLSFMSGRVFKPNNSSMVICTALSGFGTLLSLAFVTGYLVGKPLLYGMDIIPPAFNTSLSFLALSAALTIESFFHEQEYIEDAVSAINERFKNAFEHSAEGKSMIYINGAFQANRAFAEMLGYTVDEFAGINWKPATHPDDQKMSQDVMDRMINENIESSRFEKRYIHKDGHVVWVDLQTFLQRDPSGKPLYFITSASDINASKALQQQLIEAKEQAERSNQLKDAFIANMSHEIRTPLNAILGFSDLVREDLLQAGSSEFESYFEIIRNSGIRLMRTVDMILNVSRLQVGAYEVRPVKINLVKMIDDLVAEYRLPVTNKGLSIEFQNQLDNPVIVADEYCMIHAISNLIDNAVKYTQKGSIILTLYHSGDALICLDVSDTGIGISEDFLKQIFHPFTQEENSFTRQFEGIGLGLSIAHKMLAVTGSVLSVKSLKGVGTTFTITFPG